MAGSMKDIKLRIKSVESTMQITKAMELVASSKMRRAKERVEHSRPYFETLHDTLTGIAAADPRARSPYLRRAEIKRTLLVVIAGDRGLAGGYNSNVLKQAEAQQGPVTVLPIGKRSQEYFAHHGADLFTEEVLLAADVSVGECFALSRKITEGYLKGDYDAVKLCYTRFDSMMTQTAVTMEVLPLTIEPTEEQKAAARRSQILYKPSSEEVFRAIIPEYVAGIVTTAPVRLPSRRRSPRSWQAQKSKKGVVAYVRKTHRQGDPGHRPGAGHPVQGWRAAGPAQRH